MCLYSLVPLHEPVYVACMCVRDSADERVYGVPCVVGDGATTRRDCNSRSADTQRTVSDSHTSAIGVNVAAIVFNARHARMSDSFLF